MDLVLHALGLMYNGFRNSLVFPDILIVQFLQMQVVCDILSLGIGL